MRNVNKKQFKAAYAAMRYIENNMYNLSMVKAMEIWTEQVANVLPPDVIDQMTEVVSATK